MLEEISHLISHFNEIFNTLSPKDLIFLEFQDANQQNTFFKEEVRNTVLAPFNTKCLFRKLKFQQPPATTKPDCLPPLLLQYLFSLQFKTFSHNF